MSGSERVEVHGPSGKFRAHSSSSGHRDSTPSQAATQGLWEKVRHRIPRCSALRVAVDPIWRERRRSNSPAADVRQGGLRDAAPYMNRRSPPGEPDGRPVECGRVISVFAAARFPPRRKEGGGRTDVTRRGNCRSGCRAGRRAAVGRPIWTRARVDWEESDLSALPQCVWSVGRCRMLSWRWRLRDARDSGRDGFLHQSRPPACPPGSRGVGGGAQAGWTRMSDEKDSLCSHIFR